MALGSDLIKESCHQTTTTPALRYYHILHPSQLHLMLPSYAIRHERPLNLYLQLRASEIILIPEFQSWAGHELNMGVYYMLSLRGHLNNTNLKLKTENLCFFLQFIYTMCFGGLQMRFHRENCVPLLFPSKLQICNFVKAITCIIYLLLSGFVDECVDAQKHSLSLQSQDTNYWPSVHQTEFLVVFADPCE